MKFRIEFFNVTEKDGNEDFTDFVDNIKISTPNLRDRTIKVGNNELQFDTCDPVGNDDNIIIGWIRKIVDEHPKSADINSPNETKIELKKNNELVVRSYFLYDNNRKLLLVQRSNAGPGKAAFAKYLISLSKKKLDKNDQRRFSFVPCADKNAIDKLQNTDIIKTLNIKPYKTQNQITNDLQASEVGRNSPILKAQREFTDVDAEYVIKDFSPSFLKKVFGIRDSKITFEDFSEYYEKVSFAIKEPDGTTSHINLSTLYAKKVYSVGDEKTVDEELAKSKLKEALEWWAENSD